MRIGSFAKLCKTQISVLRHYDKVGLIKPDYIDKFTDYRYYAPEQAKDFELISKFKKLGFSLKDIKKIMTLWDKHSNETEKIFDDKIKELEDLITQIKHEKGNLLNLNKENLNVGNNNDLNVNIDDIKFEDDPEAVGKWEIIGEYDTKDDFLSEIKPNKSMYGEKLKEIYFLPNGQRYWVYGWTKGLVINDNGDYTAVNPYTIEEINGEKYMFVEWASYHYIKHGGEKTILVLKQRDRKHYSKREIGIVDYTDLPFDNDEAVIGKWNAVDFVNNIEDFEPLNKKWNGNLYYTAAVFLPGGILHNYYNKNNPIINENMKWTKGTTLLRWGDGLSLAPAYEIRNINGTDYLFIEWKSGDYVWGKMKPNYYVFVRE